MTQPAARLTDTTGHGGLIADPGAPTVLVMGQPAPRMGGLCTCVGPPAPIVKGEPTVLIGP